MDAIVSKQIERLRRQYLQLINPQDLCLPSLHALKFPQVQHELYTRVVSHAEQRFSPPQRYEFRVMKRLMGLLEASFEDPDQDVRLSLNVSLRGISFSIPIVW